MGFRAGVGRLPESYGSHGADRHLLEVFHKVFPADREAPFQAALPRDERRRVLTNNTSSLLSHKQKSNQGVSNLCKAERADLHKGMVGPLCFQTSQPPEFCDWRCRRSTCSVSATSEQHILWQSLKTRPHSSQPWETTGPLFGKCRAVTWWQLYLSYSQQA